MGQAHVQQEGPSAGAEMGEPRGDFPEGSAGLSRVSVALLCLREEPQDTLGPMLRKHTSVYSLPREGRGHLVSQLKTGSPRNHCECPLSLTWSLLNVIRAV